MSENISIREFDEKFRAAVLPISESFVEFSEKFYILTRLLIEENEKTNLTAIKDIDGIILKHYADCLLIEKFITHKAEMIDVGCGGGFPTLPLAIVREDVSITALDSTAKKLGFISTVSKELSLNIQTLARRAEEIGREEKYRERFDVVTARAVSAMNVLDELCLPLTKKGGVFIAMKGSSGHDELISALPGIKKLGGEPREYTEMLGDMERHIIVTNKVNDTPSIYPRMYSKIVKSPLK